MANEMLVELTTLAEKIAKNKPLVKDKAQTLTEFVKPFFKILGYDDIEVYIPECKGVRCAILSNGAPLAVIVVEHHSVELGVGKVIHKLPVQSTPDSQLKTTFGFWKCVLKFGALSFGILTNGLEYHFYSDNGINRTSVRPFMTLNFESTPLKSHLDADKLAFLELFRRENLQNEIHTIQCKAETLLDKKIENDYFVAIKTFLEKELDKPSDDFVRFIYRAFDNTMLIDDFHDNEDIKKHISRALKEIINDKVKKSKSTRNQTKRK